MIKNLTCKVIFTLVLAILSVNLKVSAQVIPADAGAVSQDDVTKQQVERTEEKYTQETTPTTQVEGVETLKNNKLSPEDVFTSVEDKVKSPSIFVKQFTIDSSEIFSDEMLRDFLSKYENKSYTMAELQQIVNKINTAYKTEGVVTAKAFIPPQEVQDGIINIKLVEGHVGTITIEGNKYTRESYIKRWLSPQEGELFSLKELENSIVKFNRKNLTKLKANVKPGKLFGTTDIEITVDDPQPIHLSASFDNLGRETIGVLRGTPMIRHNNLLGMNDQFYAGYSGAKYNHAAFAGYTLPINDNWNLNAGFNFNTIEIGRGPFSFLDIDGNAFIYSLMVNRALIYRPTFDVSLGVGVDFKEVETTLLNTRISKNQIRNLNVALNATKRGKGYVLFANSTFTNGLDLLGGNARFFKNTNNLTFLKSLPWNSLFILRNSFQLTDDALPTAEQFQIGGAYTIRGYSEGLLIGDNGYLASGEVRFPLPILPKDVKGFNLRDKVFGVVFIDHGGAFPDDGNATVKRSRQTLTSIGTGLRINLTKYINARVDWGFGLAQRENPQPTGRLHFGLEGSLL